MTEIKTSNPLETYSRGLLRAGVCTVNNQLRVILSRHFPEYEIVNDNDGKIYLTDKNCHNWNFKPYGTSLKTLNDLFFFSPQNLSYNNAVAQAYTAFGSNSDIRKKLIESEICSDVPVTLDPILKNILLDNEKNTRMLRERVDADFNAGKLSLPEAMKRKKKKFPLRGEDYRQYLINNGYEGKELEKMIELVNIFNYSFKNSRLVDFLDIYGLYHYYVFRHIINVKFNNYINVCENAGHSLSQMEKKLKFEQILNQEAYNHCIAKPNPYNHYFYHTQIGLTRDRIDVAKAKELALEVKNMPSAIQDNIKEKIDYELNKVNTYNHSVHIKDFFIQPKPGLIKKDQPKLKPMKLNKTDNSPRVITVINTILKRNKPEVQTENTSEQLREILTGAKVVSESRRCGYYRDLHKKSDNQPKDQPKTDDSKQLDLFDDTM